MLIFPHRSTLPHPFFHMLFVTDLLFPTNILSKLTSFSFFFSSFHPLGTQWKPSSGGFYGYGPIKLYMWLLDCFCIDWYFWDDEPYTTGVETTEFRDCVCGVWLCDLGIWCVWNRVIMKIDTEYIFTHQFSITLQIREKQQSQTTNRKSKYIWLLLHLQVMLLTLKTIGLFRILSNF